MFLGRSYSTIHLCLAGQIRADLENQDSTMHLTFSPIQPNRDSWILLSLTFVGFGGIWFFWWVVWVFFSISSYCSFELQFLFDRGALEKNYKDTSFQPSCLKDSQSTGGYSGAVALPVYPVLKFLYKSTICHCQDAGALHCNNQPFLPSLVVPPPPCYFTGFFLLCSV